MEDKNLIFIISQPRSGSTFLQSLLSNNKEINTSSESWIMLALSPLLKPDSVKDAVYDHAMATDAFHEYCTRFKINCRDHLKELAFNFYSPMIKGFSFIIDKTPRYWEILDELYALFPEAKYIILQRNPVAVVESMINTWKIKTLNQLQYLGRDLLLAPQVITKFRHQYRQRKNVQCLRYEELVEDTEVVTRKLYKWIGIPFEQVCLDTSSNKKVLGKYGDPFINGLKKQNHETPSQFHDFLKGYAHYLGSEYIEDFGLQTEKFSKTNDFDCFRESVLPS